MKNVVYINGSPKRNGATDALQQLLIQHLGSNMFYHTVVNLSDCKIQYCLGCKYCYKTGCCVQSDDMNSILQTLAAADIIVTLSPSYWADITGQMKVFNRPLHAVLLRT